jgi:hypothetical protein
MIEPFVGIDFVEHSARPDVIRYSPMFLSAACNDSARRDNEAPCAS